MIFLFAIYQQNKSVCLNWNKNIFRISNIFRVVCWFLFVLCSVYMVNLDGYLYLFETKPCTVTSKDNQREKKNYASDWGKQWKTVFVVFRYFRYFFNFTMFCFAFCSSSSSSFFFFWGGRVEFITTLIFNTILHEKWKSICMRYFLSSYTERLPELDLGNFDSLYFL